MDFTAGSSTMPSSSAAATSRPADSGRVTNTLQAPRDSSSARRRFSSVSYTHLTLPTKA